jgi:ABC-type nitrate/sulfonate/bicarbonate transport system permease component
MFYIFEHCLDKRDTTHVASVTFSYAGSRHLSAVVGEGGSSRLTRLADGGIFVLSWAAALVVWEAVSRSGAISENDLPAMSTTMNELWSLVQTRDFWAAFGSTVRGWALGLGIATLLAVPLGVALGISDFAARAFRVPIEFLRPIPSAVLIPLLFLTLGTSLKSEVFLATFGAFWPLLVQTMYGVHDVDPVATDTARSFGVRPAERLYRITLPSAVPYIATGMRIASTVALILAFTAELFMGTPGLGQELNIAQSYGLTTQVYALALATGVLGISTYVAFAALERRVLRWHPSQRAEAL